MKRAKLLLELPPQRLDPLDANVQSQAKNQAAIRYPLLINA